MKSGTYNDYSDNEIDQLYSACRRKDGHIIILIKHLSYLVGLFPEGILTPQYKKEIADIIQESKNQMGVKK